MYFWLSVALIIRMGYHSLTLCQGGVNGRGRESHKETGVIGTGRAVTDRGSQRH